jgi:hypothetical protein
LIHWTRSAHGMMSKPPGSPKLSTGPASWSRVKTRSGPFH